MHTTRYWEHGILLPANKMLLMTEAMACHVSPRSLQTFRGNSLVKLPRLISGCIKQKITRANIPSKNSTGPAVQKKQIAAEQILFLPRLAIQLLTVQASIIPMQI